ncbi:MAG: PmoA family protein [Verrucomicrobiales bacterium]
MIRFALLCFAATSAIAVELPLRFSLVLTDAQGPASVVTTLLPTELETPPDTIPDVFELVSESEARAVPAQLGPGQPRMLQFMPGSGPAGERPRTFELRGWRKAGPTPLMRITEGENAITLLAGDKKILTYLHGNDPAPEGANPLFVRSGFIYPLWSPSGDELTQKRPSDHFHHMGVWHAWTKAEFSGQDVDFWNLGKGLGTVRFKEYRWKTGGSIWCGFRARQEHVAFKTASGEQVILDEDLDVRAFAAPEGFYLDYDFAQKNIASHPLLFPAYRYGGGIGYRGPASWKRDNSNYLTSEGKTRDDGHATRGRWCAMSGPTPHGSAGIGILCHPDNHDAPQRMRLWGDDKEGRIFFNYVPIQETDWQIKPGETIRMRYRLFIFEGAPNRDRIESAWRDYARPPKVVWQ